MKLLYEKEVPLLNRKRIAFEVEHSNKSTPSRLDLKKDISKNLEVNENLISVRHIYTKFGKNKSKVIVHVYKNEKDLNALEKIRRGEKKKEKKKEAPKQEPKKEEIPKEIKEEKPVEEKKE